MERRKICVHRSRGWEKKKDTEVSFDTSKWSGTSYTSTHTKASQNTVWKLDVFLNCMQGWYWSVNSLWLFLCDRLHMQTLLPDRSVNKFSYLCYLEEEKGGEDSIAKRELSKAVSLVKKVLAMNFFSYLCYKSRPQPLNWLFKQLN